MKKPEFRLPATLILIIISLWGNAQTSSLKDNIDSKVNEIESKVVEWRHHLHQYPELSNREFKTSAYIEKHLRSLGLEVRREVAHTGLIAVLRGGKPGPVVALRADMDGLPVEERVDLPYASKEKGIYNNAEVPVMHACGHDIHMAVAMGAAEVLSSMKDQLQGTIVFLFQPAEEGAPKGEEGGAELMVKEGALKDPPVDVVFGLHVNSAIESGKIRYRPGAMMAAVNTFTMKVKGKQTHGSTPWTGIDPIVTSAQIIMGLQTIISRQTELTRQPAVISVGKITGGVRSNIIPEEVEMVGTIRTLDTAMQRIIHEKIRHTATTIAASMGATVEIDIDKGYPVTYNDIELTRKMLPTLFEVAGEDNVNLDLVSTGAEDFSFFALEVPGMFFRLGGLQPGVPALEAPPHHTPYFRAEDSCLALGVRAMCYLAVDYMEQNVR